MRTGRKSTWSTLKKRYSHLKAILRARRARARRLLEPETVPYAYTGKWIAWSSDGLRIVAAADSPRAARLAAVDAGEDDPICEWIPPAGQLRSSSLPVVDPAR